MSAFAGEFQEVKTFTYTVHNDPERYPQVKCVEWNEELKPSPALSASLEVLLLQLFVTVGTRPQRHVERLVSSRGIEVEDKVRGTQQSQHDGIEL